MKDLPGLAGANSLKLIVQIIMEKIFVINYQMIMVHLIMVVQIIFGLIGNIIVLVIITKQLLMVIVKFVLQTVFTIRVQTKDYTVN